MTEPKHPLEELAEEWGKVSVHDGFYEKERDVMKACARGLRQTLASLWRPFYAENEGTWPEEDNAFYLVWQHAKWCRVGLWDAESKEWLSDGSAVRMRGVTHYAELLPGPSLPQAASRPPESPLEDADD